LQKYRYTAVNLQNKKIRGTFIAKDEKDLAEQLAKQSLYLVSASLYYGGIPSAFFTLGTGRVKHSELASLCRQLAIMLSAHVPLPECIDVLKNQSFCAYLCKTLSTVSEDVKSGLLLSEALDKHKGIFPVFLRSMTAVGERSGRLDLVFNALADYYERESAQRAKLRAALAYPLMLLAMTVGIAVLMLTFVIPKFKSALADMDVPIEGLTKTVYGISDFVLEWWHVILAGTLTAALLIALFLKTEKGKSIKDALLLKLPLIRSLEINAVTSRFTGGLSLLLCGGMDLAKAMEAAELTVTNRYMKRRLHLATDYVCHGMSLTNALESTGIFPEMLIRMIHVGEKTNSLDDVLARSSAAFDAQLEASFTAFSSKIQPIMIAIMGLIVAAMFIAIYAPMLSIMGAL
jgi:type IV pilus assembly protein PilC